MLYIYYELIKNHNLCIVITQLIIRKSVSLVNYFDVLMSYSSTSKGIIFKIWHYL